MQRFLILLFACSILALSACKTRTMDSGVKDVELRKYNEPFVFVIYSEDDRVIIKKCNTIRPEEPKRDCQAATVEASFPLDEYHDYVGLDIGNYPDSEAGLERLKADLEHAKNVDNTEQVKILEGYLKNYNLRRDLERLLSEETQDPVLYPDGGENIDPQFSYEQLLDPATSLNPERPYCEAQCNNGHPYRSEQRELIGSVMCRAGQVPMAKLKEIANQLCKSKPNCDGRDCRLDVFGQNTMVCWKADDLYPEALAEYESMEPGTCQDG